MGGVEADLAEVTDLHVGQEHGLLVFDLRGVVRRCVDLLLEVGDEVLALVRLADRSRTDHDVLAPGGPPSDLVLGEGHGRGDLTERLVVLGVDAGVAGEDDVPVGVVDRLEVDAVGLVEQDRCVVTGGTQFLELLLDPGKHRRASEVRLGHADRDDVEGQGHLLVLEVHRGDPLRGALDLGGAEGVLDGDGVSVVGGAGGQCETECRGQRQQDGPQRAGAGHGGVIFPRVTRQLPQVN